jgi:hypothetical protein
MGVTASAAMPMRRSTGAASRSGSALLICPTRPHRPRPPRHRVRSLYGASDNERAWWDNSDARRYGYRPTGRGEEHRDAALAAEAGRPPDPIADWYQGGPFCSDEYDGVGDLAER